MKPTRIGNSVINTTVTTTNYYELSDLDPEIVKLEENITKTEEIKEDKTVKTHNISYKLVTSKKIEKTFGRPIIFCPEFLEVIKTKNPFSQIRNFLYKDYQLDIKDINLIPEGVILFLNFGSHELWDLEFNPVSYCRQITYHEDHTLDFNQKFLDFLRNHPWVIDKDVSIRSLYDCSDYIDLEVYVDQETFSKIYKEAHPNGRYQGYKIIVDYISSNNYRYNKKKFTDWFGLEPYLT